MIRFSGHSRLADPIPLRRGASPPRTRDRPVRRSRSRGGRSRCGPRLDAPRLEADERVGDGAREHSSDARAASATDGKRVCNDFVESRREHRGRGPPLGGDVEARLAGRRHGRDPGALRRRRHLPSARVPRPDHGLAGVRRYLETNFAVERETECWFAEPLVAGDRAAVEWWGTGRARAAAHPRRCDVPTLRRCGRVIDHRDYWNQVERREPPYDGWS